MAKVWPQVTITDANRSECPRGAQSETSKVVPRVDASNAPYGLTDDDRIALSATGGRYRDLREWAEQRGLTVTQAQQRWHALRVPCAKGRPL